MTTIRVGHLYPDYLNIYADRGNIAVLARRAAWRRHEVAVASIGIADEIRPGQHDLLYVGGGQDREQALDRGLELTPAGGELAALPTYTAMLALRDLVARRGFVRPYWEEAA